MMRSIVQSARPLAMPHSSLTSRGRSGARRAGLMTSGERKEHVLQTGCWQTCLATQLVERAHAADRAAREQHEAVADALGVVELMNRQHECAAARRHAANE